MKVFFVLEQKLIKIVSICCILVYLLNLVVVWMPTYYKVRGRCNSYQILLLQLLCTRYYSTIFKCTIQQQDRFIPAIQPSHTQLSSLDSAYSYIPSSITRKGYILTSIGRKRLHFSKRNQRKQETSSTHPINQSFRFHKGYKKSPKFQMPCESLFIGHGNSKPSFCTHLVSANMLIRKVRISHV